MRVDDHARVAMWAPHARFKFVRSPFFVWSDFPWQSGVNMWSEADDVVSDFDLQCIYPKPIRVPHNVILTSPPTQWQQIYDSLTQGGGSIRQYWRSDTPTLNWRLGAGNTFTFASVNDEQIQPWYGQTGDLQLGVSVNILKLASSDTKVFEIETVPGELDSNGCVFSAGQTHKQQTEITYGGQAPTTNPDKPLDVRFAVCVGSGEDARWYEVRFSTNGDVGIWIKDPDAAAFSQVRRIAGGGLPAGQQYGIGGSGYAYLASMVEFRLLAGRLQIRIGDNEEAYSFEENRIDADKKPITKITQAKVRAEKIQHVAFFFWVLKWRRTASFFSSEIPIGFYSTNIGEPHVDAAGEIPSGWDAAVDLEESELTGPIATYKLQFTGPNDGTWKEQQYSDDVMAVRSVNLNWLPSVSGQPTFPLYPRPEAVRVRHELDINTLEIHSAAELHFNNNRMLSLPTGEFGYWGQWMNQYGQVAVEVELQRTSAAFGGRFGALVFTGYGHTQGEVHGAAGASTFVMRCEDRYRQLMSPRFALPWMDGWNVYYAMAYLAQLGGIDLADMGFRALVPQIPFGPGSDLGNGEGGPAYYLPVGEAGSVLTRFSGANLWEVMGKIAFSIGYMRFFDVNGRLQFRKFRLPAGVWRVFYESDRESGGLEGCWSISVRKNMDEVRSDAIVVGIDAYAPRWDPVAARYSDENVVDRPRAANHLGYRNPAVTIDNIFADPYFCEASAFEQIRFLRVPGLDCSITTWLQPDVFPLDVIMVQSPKSGVAWTRMMVTSVEHYKGQEGPGFSTITSRFVPE